MTVSPTTTTVVCLKGNKRQMEHRLWEDWLQYAARLFDRHYGRWANDDPFGYNEAASVSLLAAAASFAGHVVQTEFSTQKKVAGHPVVGTRGTDRRYGRGDLLIRTEKRSWAFEFKQRFGKFTESYLRTDLERASKCADAIFEDEDGVPVAALIMNLSLIEDDEKIEKSCEVIEQFARNSDIDFCWRLDPPDKCAPTYFCFTIRAESTT
ncbi:hypothetical protein [Sphingomicrobium flavum]|uniref:hypothetical protein n=1 Tax=Sphingomicrobium flavum TaxID=1229164 RepID=UPI0021AD7731|nr:hypothetical protein [Sphingomicrobium flavum]